MIKINEVKYNDKSLVTVGYLIDRFHIPRTTLLYNINPSYSLGKSVLYEKDKAIKICNEILRKKQKDF